RIVTERDVMAFPILLLVSAVIPDVPAAVQIISENQTYVMRSADEAKPLYIFNKDPPGKSICNDRCAVA
ncbi:MAG TPA: hypothetical protein VF503_26200, partial [Sphingobium sp.]